MPKLTAQTEITDPVNTDLTYVVDDPTGTPASRRCAIWREVMAGLVVPVAGSGAGTEYRWKGQNAGSGNSAGGSVVLEPGALSGSGLNGSVIIREPGGVVGTDEARLYYGPSGTAKLTIEISDGGPSSVKFKLNTLSSMLIGQNYVMLPYLAFVSDADQSIVTGGLIGREVTGVISTKDFSGGGYSTWLQNTAGESRVSADVTNATTTMANITGLSATLIAGRKYNGKLILFCANSVAVDGLKVDFDGGTATMTSFRAHGTVFDTALLLSAQTTAIATDFVVPTVTGDAMIEIHFGFVCNAAGTFIPRFAKNSHTTGTGTIYLNSEMTMRDKP